MKEAKIIATTSDKPGVGKTLVTKELVAFISKNTSLKTLVVDVDTQNFSIATAFGINDAAANNYNTIVAINKYFEDSLNESFDFLEFQNSLYKFDKNKEYRHYFENTFILPMGKPFGNEYFKQIQDADYSEYDVITSFFNEMKKHFDLIIIDTNSNYMEHVLSQASLVVADEIMLVTSNDTNSIKSTKHYSEKMKLNSPSLFKKTILVYNQVPEYFEYEDTEEFFISNLKYFANFFRSCYKVKKVEQEVLDNALISNKFISIAEVDKTTGLFIKKTVTTPFDEEFTQNIKTLAQTVLKKKEV